MMSRTSECLRRSSRVQNKSTHAVARSFAVIRRFELTCLRFFMNYPDVSSPRFTLVTGPLLPSLFLTSSKMTHEAI